MHREFLMGNEAMALGALAAGVNVVSGYPGTPSTEVLETIRKRTPGNVYIEWSVNEKAGMEVAAGAAYSGARSLVTMKQVGLNVAADPLMSLEYIGVKGAMVVLVADDPGPISSQTEQDTRTFAMFSKLPVFDPSTVQEAYDMMQAAFELSEQYHTPVFLRPTTRIDHGYESVTVKDEAEYRQTDPEGFIKDPQRWVIFPRLSVRNHALIEERNDALRDVFSELPYNTVVPAAGVYAAPQTGNESGAIPQVGNESGAAPQGGNGSGAAAHGKRLGIVSHGSGWAIARDCLSESDHPALLKIGTPFPFPEKAAKTFLEETDEILVIEELDPVLERALIYTCGKFGLHVKIRGKLDGTVKRSGENAVDEIRALIAAFAGVDCLREAAAAESAQADAASKANGSTAGSAQAAGTNKAAGAAEATEAPLPALPVRPPVLCAGCPHRASFYAVKQAMKGQKTIFCGDIGCYTLGNAKPLDMCDTCLCMGAGINIAQGVWHVEPDTKAFAFVGDSTFFASGITGSVNGLFNQSDMTLVVLDNSTTAMTGHQPHPGTGQTMMGDVVDKVDIEATLRGIGVKTVETVNPLHHEEAVATVKRVAAEPGFKAIIFKYPCIVKFRPTGAPAKVDPDTCVGCRRCIKELGCPGVIFKDGKAAIDPQQCTGCTLCEQVCPVGAISGGEAAGLGEEVAAAQAKIREKALATQQDVFVKARELAAAMGHAAGADDGKVSKGNASTEGEGKPVQPAGGAAAQRLDLVMAGVGGQGTILASKLIADAAMARGQCVHTAETIGMAQRGGSVMSYLRLGEGILSPLLGHGSADIIIGFEPGETLRMLPYLKKGGTVISSTHPIYPVSAMTGMAPYDVPAVIEALKARVPDLILIDTDAAMDKLGNSKVMNMILLGAAVRSGRLGISAEEIRAVLMKRLPEKLWEVNFRALEYPI